jgi:hypothetical protein
MAELDSIRIIIHHCADQGKNIYFLLTLLFSLYPVFICISDHVSREHGRRQCHGQHRLDNTIASMVVGNAMTNVDLVVPLPA